MINRYFLSLLDFVTNKSCRTHRPSVHFGSCLKLTWMHCSRVKPALCTALPFVEQSSYIMVSSWNQSHCEIAPCSGGQLPLCLFIPECSPLFHHAHTSGCSAMTLTSRSLSSDKCLWLVPEPRQFYPHRNKWFFTVLRPTLGWLNHHEQASPSWKSAQQLYLWQACPSARWTAMHVHPQLEN